METMTIPLERKAPCSDVYYISIKAKHGTKNTNSGMQLHDQQKQWHKLIKHKTENTLKIDRQRLVCKRAFWLYYTNK